MSELKRMMYILYGSVSMNVIILRLSLYLSKDKQKCDNNKYYL